jgi:diguanylate cyclase (GGDEF)-like protein
MVSQNAILRRAVAPELRNWVNNRLISAHIRIVRAMVVGTLLNAAMLVTGLWSSIPLLDLALFGLSTLAACLHRQWLAEGIARGRRQKRAEKMTLAFELNSLWLGLTFGVLFLRFFATVGPDGQILMGLCAIAQIASAAYTIRTLPRSATLYIVTQALGLSLGLLHNPSLAALGSIAVLASASGLLIRMTHTAHDLFVTRILSDRELASTNRTVKLLLNEYEESGSDWIFELDPKGCLIKVSPRFARAADEPASILEGRSFAGLFAAGDARNRLADALAERRVLRNELLELAFRAGTDSARWWSVSGRPCYESDTGNIAYRGVISDVSSQRLAEKRVRHMAHFDSLTGLPNRELFNQTLTAILEERQGPTGAALLLIDVDHFKTVNDMYGHPVGDGVLREIAARLTQTLESSCLGGTRQMIARLSGDEFAIVLCDEDACDHAVRLAELLIASLDEPIVVEGHEINSGISLGIALAPQHAAVMQHLLSNADIALYAAKNGGRRMWEMFAPGMDEALHDRHTLARDLRHVISRGELELFVQPLVEVETGAMTGYEALLRWHHPSRGMVPPDLFIPIAEETGLIVPIGEWVIRTALAEAARWPGGETIAINLSPLQLSSPNLLPVIVQALADNQLDPARIEFEITEGVLLHNSQANIEVLNKLHALGLKVALDDFGTGYASLNYLLTFPFDKIKIDRRFVADLATREDSRAIVRAVIRLANELGMCTLAEGVEDQDQLEHLRQQGCRMVQGWLFGKALPPDAYHPEVAIADAARRSG